MQAQQQQFTPAPSAPQKKSEAGGSQTKAAVAGAEGYDAQAAKLAPPQEGGGPLKGSGKVATQGAELAAVQNKLNELGFDCGKADGIMGPKTKSAITSFQKSKGLSPTGSADETTVSALNEAQPVTPTPGQAIAKTPTEPKEKGSDKGEDKPGPTAPTPTTSPTPTSSNAGSAPANKQAPDGEMSEGDRLRASIAGQAESWNGKEFMSQQEIESVREKSGLKNYTTCIDFAGKMMREGTKDMYGQDWKKAAETAKMLGQVKADWEQGVGQRIQAAAMQKAVDRFDKAIADVEAKKAKTMSEIEDLRRPKAEGESDMAVKQREIRAKALEGQVIKALDGVIKQLQSQRAGFQKKVDAANEKAQSMDAKNTAMIKASDGMSNGRPKEGEYIILSQAPGGGNYGVSKETQVHLAAGSFKHIAIFMGVEKEDDGSGVETWRTIDGGGTKGKETKLFVRKADRMVFPAYHGASAPEAGSASKSQIAGWIDMDELVKMRDAKASGGK